MSNVKLKKGITGTIILIYVFIATVIGTIELLNNLLNAFFN